MVVCNRNDVWQAKNDPDPEGPLPNWGILAPNENLQGCLQTGSRNAVHKLLSLQPSLLHRNLHNLHPRP
jgi:hypothetical protein